MNNVGCFVAGFFVAAAFVFGGNLMIFALDFSFNVNDLGSIKSNGTSVPKAMSASAANLQPFELGLRSSACCKSKPDVGMDTLRFSYPLSAAFVRGRDNDELCDDVE